ncbi:MAG: MFS transporter [SAR116 cluster bacterium]|nr:MAG: MFS transporter [SAR116 cluster bacterium]
MALSFPASRLPFHGPSSGHILATHDGTTMWHSTQSRHKRPLRPPSSTVFRHFLWKGFVVCDLVMNRWLPVQGGLRQSRPGQEMVEKPALGAFTACRATRPHGEIPAMSDPVADPIAAPRTPGLDLPTSTLDFMRVEWRFLLFGMAMAFCSSLGQTFFISLFSAEIRGELGLSHGAFGTYYAIGTTASAITLLWLGKLADTMRVEKLARLVICCLCASALLFSQVYSVATLIIGLYLLRLFGQGMTSHVYTTAMARRYVAARGRALSLAQLGINFAESIGPASIVALLVIYDWRTLWLFLPLLPLVGLVPFIRRLTQRTRYQDGGGLEGVRAAAAAAGIDDRQDAAIVTIDGVMHWRRRAVIRDRRFWLGLVGLSMVPGFSVTGLLFHQIYIAELAGVTLGTWAANYVIYAACVVAGTLISGQLVDRFTGRRVAAHLMLPIGLACLSLWLVEGSVGVLLFFIFFGLASGMPNTAVAATMAEMYGTRYLGEVKAIFLPLGVFSSALSPMAMGMLIDAGYGMATLMAFNIGLALLAQAGATWMLTKPPVGQR